jgi:acetyl-CoA carboxylase biotin carboxylase subunit
VDVPGLLAKVLIANRGEIAVRLIRACREMGIATVAVYSDADAASPHVWYADEAVHLGPADPAQSYLNVGRLIDAARRSGAQAVHPGYGFLAEHAGFAAACRDAGLTFIGPPAEVLAALGDKAAARRLADAAGVPVVPGLNAVAPDDEALYRAAQRLGYPVLLKAVAGGGGRGLRVVYRPDDLGAAAEQARREARSAFGDDALIVERFLERCRHVEVQVLADAHGNVVQLGERECSLQRRHQKVVEESPSVAVDPRLRQALGHAAVRIMKAAHYVSAGTVEFLLDGEGRFFFLEVNTRLQVEHPVTELVTGIDLVAAQLRVAVGEPLQVRQDKVALRGHALECRIYAEDPAAGFAPSPGRVLRLVEPQRPGVRVDSGIRAGQDVPIEYDPILAKVIAWAPVRADAVRKMQHALGEYVVLGVQTNIPFLRDVVAHPAFSAGELSTDFLHRHFAGWRQREPSPDVCAVAAAIAEIVDAAIPGPGRPAPDALHRAPDPWDRLTGWRLG